MVQYTPKELVNSLSYKNSCTKCGHAVKTIGMCTKCGKKGGQTPIVPIVEEDEDDDEDDIQIGTQS